MFKKTIGILAVAGLVLALAPAASADVISFQEGVSPTGAYAHDAVYFRSSHPNDNQNGDTDREVIVGFTNDNNELRGLLEFDISDIPALNAIDSASLVLRTGGGLSSSLTVNVYEYDFNFDETTATWTTPAPGDGAAGGTLGTLLTSATFNPSAGPRSSSDVTFSDTPAFRTAVSDAQAGDGFLRLILARSDNSGSGQQRFARFDDETATTSANRPELVVEHSIPEPATMSLLALGGFGVLCKRRKRA